MASWREPLGAKMLTIFVAASNMGAASGRLNSRPESYICGNACIAGSTAVNLWQCGISESNAHQLRACFDNIGRNSIETLDLGGNDFTTLPEKIFEGMFSLTALLLDQNELTALPDMVFEGLPSLVEVGLRGNPELLCVSKQFSNIVRVEDQSILSSESCETNPCLDSRHPDFRCAGHEGTEILDLSSCRLTDGDFCGVEACFIAADRVTDLTTINLEGNEFTSSVVNQVQELLLPEAVRPKAMLGCAHPTIEMPIKSGKPHKPHMSDRRKGKREKRRLSETSVGNLGIDYHVSEHQTPASEEEVEYEPGTATPPAWDSSLCMSHWGRQKFLQKPDPGGYLIFVDGREQLGGNRNLVSDGLFFAKTLNRTLVEFPVNDSRVAPFGKSHSGLGIYWDLDRLCMYHRILDLGRFRAMVTEGQLPADNFVTLQAGRLEEYMTSHLHTKEDTTAFFKKFVRAQASL